jgi:hypothetical protein
MDEHKKLMEKINKKTDKEKMRVNAVGSDKEPTKHKETIIDDPMIGIENMIKEEEETKEKNDYIFKIQHILNTSLNVPDFSLKNEFKGIVRSHMKFNRFQENLYKFEHIKEITKTDNYIEVETNNMKFYDYGLQIEVKSIEQNNSVYLRSIIKLISYITIKYYILQGFNKNEKKHCYFDLSFKDEDKNNIELLIMFDALYNNKENHNFTIEFTDNQNKILNYYKKKTNFYRNIRGIKNEITKNKK